MTQQPPIQSAEPIASDSGQNPAQKKGSLRKIFNISSWMILFTFLPITVLIFLSQDSIPGDSFYPIKRGMEGIVLAAASVNPATKAAFQTDLTEKRFKEAQTLVLSKSNTQGLSTFAKDVEAAEVQISLLSNNSEREKAEEKLISKLEEYQNNLTALEVKTQQNLIVYQPQNLPSPTPTIFAPSPTEPLSQQLPQPSSTPTPTPAPLPSVSQTPLILTPTPSQVPSPTLTVSPTESITVPTAQPTQVPQDSVSEEQEKVVEEIKKTKEKIDKIKRGLEEKRESNRGRRERP
ncbi:MAG: hypothetical protein HYT10_03320 [Candidatus Levybacteria bacterium]|nr:hypothetical protein [Candidatus Levybacteria bacterium]